MNKLNLFPIILYRTSRIRISAILHIRRRSTAEVYSYSVLLSHCKTCGLRRDETPHLPGYHLRFRRSTSHLCFSRTYHQDDINCTRFLSSIRKAIRHYERSLLLHGPYQIHPRISHLPPLSYPTCLPRTPSRANTTSHRKREAIQTRAHARRSIIYEDHDYEMHAGCREEP